MGAGLSVEWIGLRQAGALLAVGWAAVAALPALARLDAEPKDKGVTAVDAGAASPAVTGQ
ncbi:hypothetical protein AB8O64_00470 [Streptomyces sp. QH1-20]|uniref:hypothetical protein n=1 Tax=Streptomyces sp. QH1-20 TaxID=3240934 RepID=UPI003517D52A